MYLQHTIKELTSISTSNNLKSGSFTCTSLCTQIYNQSTDMKYCTHMFHNRVFCLPQFTQTKYTSMAFTFCFLFLRSTCTINVNYSSIQDYRLN